MRRRALARVGEIRSVQSAKSVLNFCHDAMSGAPIITVVAQPERRRSATASGAACDSSRSGEETDSPRNAEAFDRHAHKSCWRTSSSDARSQAPTLTLGRERPHRTKSFLQRTDDRAIAVSPESLHDEIMERGMELAMKKDKRNVGKISEANARAFREWMANRKKRSIEDVLDQQAAIDVRIFRGEVGERMTDSDVDAGGVYRSGLHWSGHLLDQNLDRERIRLRLA